jgi:hypothetical protein
MRGGFRVGAGRPGRSRKTYDCLQLNTSSLLSNGVFSRPWWSGQWVWRDANTKKPISVVDMMATAQEIDLSFTSYGKPVRQTIPLVRVSNTYGGCRIFFSCPRCSSRRRILYFLHGLFLCRGCQDLPYRSQSEDLIGRLWRAQLKIEQKLGDRYKKPKGMHQATFQRLRSKIYTLEWQREDLVEEAVGDRLY